MSTNTSKPTCSSCFFFDKIDNASQWSGHCRAVSPAFSVVTPNAVWPVVQATDRCFGHEEDMYSDKDVKTPLGHPGYGEVEGEDLPDIAYQITPHEINNDCSGYSTRRQCAKIYMTLTSKYVGEDRGDNVVDMYASYLIKSLLFRFMNHKTPVTSDMMTKAEATYFISFLVDEVDKTCWLIDHFDNLPKERLRVKQDQNDTYSTLVDPFAIPPRDLKE